MQVSKTKYVSESKFNQHNISQHYSFPCASASVYITHKNIHIAFSSAFYQDYSSGSSGVPVAATASLSPPPLYFPIPFLLFKVK